MFRRTLTIAAFAALAATGLRAQLAVGDTIEMPPLEGLSQTGATTMADLTGRAVLYEFFAFW